MSRFTIPSPAPLAVRSAFRPISWRDVDGPAPLRAALRGYTGYMGSGWAASVDIDGHTYRLRGGGGLGGPRSRAVAGEPGCYALAVDGCVYEVLLPATTPVPCPLDADVTLQALEETELAALDVPLPSDTDEWED